MTPSARLVAIVGFGVWALLVVLLPAPLSTLLLFGMAAVGVGLTLRAQLAVLLPHKLRLPLLFVIGVLLVLSAAQFAQWEQRDTLHTATTLLIVAWVLLGMLLRTPYHAPVRAAPLEDAPVQTRYALLIAGVIALGLVAGGGGDLFGLDDLLSIHVEFWLLVGGVLLLIFGLTGKAPHEGCGVSFSAWARCRTTLRRFLPLLLITLLAFVLRAWTLETAVHLFVDEINFALPAKELFEGADRALLRPFSGVFAFPYLYPYAQAWGLALFGVGLSGLRFVSVVLGTLTIPAVYWLAVEIQGGGEGEREKHNTESVRISSRGGLSAFALLAALFLAVFPPHVHYSRLGLNNIADPLFGVLALAGMMGGLRTGQRWRYAAGGAALGLTQYFYEGGRLIFPPLALLWLFCVVVIGRRYGLGVRRLWIFWLAAVIVAAPVYITLLARDFPLASRLEREAIGGSYWQRRAEVNQLQPFSDHTLLPLLVYVREMDRSLFYGGDQPLVLAAAVPFLLLGVGVILWRLALPDARAASWLLVLWVGLVYLGNALLAISAISARYVLVFPALAILLAVGVMSAWRLLISAVEREKPAAETTPALWRFKNALRFTLIVVVAALCVLQVDYYFNAHLRVYNQQSRPEMDGVDALFRARELAPTTVTHIISKPQLNVGLLREIGGYLLPSSMTFRLLRSESLTDEYLNGLARNVDHAFFIDPRDEDTLALLRRHFTLSSPRCSPFYSVPLDKQFVLYLAPAVEPSSAD